MKRCSCCMGLMGNSVFCPHCGYDNRRSQEIPYALPPGSVLQGKYLIGNVLGQGGFGITYIGFDMILEVKVAIKEYYISGNASRVGSQNQQVYWMSSPGDMNHFITEARRMAKLDKMPEIAHVRDIFYANQTAYIIMEYVEGVSLNKHLQRTGVMSYEQAVKLMMPVIEALGRVHEKGLVHRDISPDNLMLEPEGKLRVLDLGAAGDLTRNNAQATQMVARRGFSPYEQYLGEEKLGPYTDVYAVCATIYYCCTGKLIPDAMRRMEQYVRSRKADLELDPCIPSAAAKVLRRGLALETNDRIPNMNVLAEQLKIALKNESENGIKTSAGQRMKNKVKSLSVQVDQLKQKLEEELVKEDVPESSARMSSQSQKRKNLDNPPKQEVKKPVHPHVSHENETKQPQETTILVNTSKEKTENLIFKYKKPLLIGAAALTAIVCIVAFGGKKEALEARVSQASDKIVDSTKTVKTAETIQIIPEVTQETVDTMSPQDMTEPSQHVTVPVTISAGPEHPAELEVIQPEETEPLDTTLKYTENNVTYCYIDNNKTITQAGVTASYGNLLLDGNETGVAIIGYEGDLPAKIVLPQEINGKMVTAIGMQAFRNCSNLTQVVIPKSVTFIGWEAFAGCTSLTNVSIPESVVFISQAAFKGCTSLTSVTIPGSAEEIGYEAFSGCTSLTSVDISVGVERIAYGAFSGCTSLANVTIPESVTNIGTIAFEKTPWLSAQTDEFLICGGGVLLKYNGSASHVEIPAGVKTIGSAFYGNPDLTGVAIPESVTRIGNAAFFECTNLTSISIPDGVTEIGTSAFYGCSGLTSISIPGGVTTIGDRAFYHCNNLTSIIIPERITEIKDDTFAGCSGLTSVAIPDGVTRIGSKAFSHCSNLRSVDIPDSVTEIGTWAFSKCTSLTSMTIPKNLTQWNLSAFADCSNLTKVVIPDGVTVIGHGAFENCISLKSVTIPDSVTKILVSAFNGCTGLTKVTIPESVVNIQGAAFWECGLSEVTVSKDCKYISGGGSVPTFPKSCKVNFY